VSLPTEPKPDKATEASPPPAASPRPARSELLRRRVRDLGLSIEGTPLEKHVKALYAELEAKGIRFHPPAYLSDEWGCPEGVPIIGVPFYLAKPELAELEQELTEDLEDERRIAMYLRHEAGHAFNYAYQLYRSGEWTELFGPFSRPYFDDYDPAPHSRQFVRHLPGWYAQMHPEEDFAETFAVWLTPDASWRERYAGTGALPKLEYVDRVAREWGPKDPAVPPRPPDQDDLDVVLEDYYARRSSAKPIDRIGAFLDGDLRTYFREGEGPPAADLLKKHRGGISHVVSDLTGARYEVVRSLLVYLTQRVEALGLVTDPTTLALHVARITALVTSLCFNYVRTGDFLGIPANQDGRGEIHP
jgi:putative zinc-binding metallo-peptidase